MNKVALASAVMASLVVGSVVAQRGAAPAPAAKPRPLAERIVHYNPATIRISLFMDEPPVPVGLRYYSAGPFDWGSGRLPEQDAPKQALFEGR